MVTTYEGNQNCNKVMTLTLELKFIILNLIVNNCTGAPKQVVFWNGQSN